MFMNDEFTTNNIENDKSDMNIEDSDYKNLILRLKDINLTIASLKKQYFDKF